MKVLFLRRGAQTASHFRGNARYVQNVPRSASTSEEVLKKNGHVRKPCWPRSIFALTVQDSGEGGPLVDLTSKQEPAKIARQILRRRPPEHPNELLVARM